MVTNIQLLLSIGIPTLMILLAMYNSNARLDSVEKRIDKRLDTIDRRLDSHEARFDDLKQSNHKDALEIMRQMTALHERVAVVEAKQAK